MTKTEANEKLEKYRYLVGKKIAQDTIAAIVPIPMDSKRTVEQMLTMIFNNVPHKLFASAKFRVVVMLNFDEFHSKGIVMWKDLDDVVALLGMQEGT